MILTKSVLIKWHSKNKKWYEERGYIFTKMKDEFEVKVEDLSDGTDVLVDIQCDGCEKILKGISWNVYLKCVKEDGKYYCHKCSMTLYASESNKKTKLKNGKSFYQWCYDNLSKEMADRTLKRWDYDLNVDKNKKVLSPKDVNSGSHGFNQKGYWFKCLEHPNHESELKNIRSFINGRGSIACNQCNFTETKHPELEKYFKNKKDMKHPLYSHTKYPMICVTKNCGYEKSLSSNTLINKGFGCPRCSDGISYPEKFFFNLLEQLLDKNFTYQLSKNVFSWCKNYKYDFYINDLKCIIETHGLQHYEKIKGGSWELSLNEIQENDRYKEQLAKENNIQNYIVIDCRKSDMDWINNSIMQSELPQLLNFKELNIDWLKCHEWALNSLVKIVCDLWESGIKNTLEISNILKVNRLTVVRYLKQGAKLKWCDYNSKEEIGKKNINMSKRKSKQVICITTGEIFNSLKEAGKHYNIFPQGISNCCNGIKNRKYAGVHPVTGESLIWMGLAQYKDIIN